MSVMQKKKLQSLLTLIKFDYGHVMKGLKQIFFWCLQNYDSDSYYLYGKVQTAMLFIAAC